MELVKRVLRSLLPLPVRKWLGKLLGIDKNHYRQLFETGISVGEGTYIYKLRKLNGARYIKVGKGTMIGRYSWLGPHDEYAGKKYAPSLEIGDYVNIGEFATITCIGHLKINDGCLISEHVYISDHVHGFDPTAGRPIDQALISKGDVEIGENTFIGYRVSILPGVKLGKHCVVGAHSVVTHSFPDYSMIAGVPARLIKTYSFQEGAWVNVGG